MRSACLLGVVRVSDRGDDRNELEKSCANLMKTMKVFEPAAGPAPK